jgi:hypothetical protein
LKKEKKKPNAQAFHISLRMDIAFLEQEGFGERFVLARARIRARLTLMPFL